METIPANFHQCSEVNTGGCNSYFNHGALTLKISGWIESEKKQRDVETVESCLKLNFLYLFLCFLRLRLIVAQSYDRLDAGGAFRRQVAPQNADDYEQQNLSGESDHVE